MIARPVRHISQAGTGGIVLIVLTLAWALGSGWTDAADVARIRALAEQGDANAQWALATLYFSGDAVPRDYEEAYRWFRAAADQGHGLAQRSLGTMYREGIGVPQDDVQAYVWYSLGAMQGSARARLARDEMAKSLTPEQLAEGERRVLAWRPTNYEVSTD